MKIRTSTLLLASLLTLPACAAEQEAGDEVVVESMEQEMPMGNMPGMGGTAAMQGDSTTQRMQAHMAAMMGESADSMHAMMPAHRQMAANMLAQMNREMQQMNRSEAEVAEGNMAGDEAWTATVDSLRQDLTRMPELSARKWRRSCALTSSA